MQELSKRQIKDKEKSFLALSTNYKDSELKNTEYLFCIFNDGTVIRYINNSRTKICKLSQVNIDLLKHYLLSQLNILDSFYKKDDFPIKINHFDIEVNLLGQKKYVSDNSELYYSIENCMNKLIVASLKNYDYRHLSSLLNAVLYVFEERIKNKETDKDT